MIFKRTDAIDMTITDENDESKIVKVIIINDQKIVFKENTIFRILLAEEIDKDNIYPNTKHTQEKLYSIGTKSPFISRILIQSDELLSVMNISNKEFLLHHIWKANQLLINCYESLDYIEKEKNQLIPKCNDIIENNKRKKYIPALPKIEQLEPKVHMFYNNAKLYLIEIFKLFNIFFSMPIKKEAHFDNHLEWLKKTFGETSDFYKILKDDIVWIRIASECRNAIEHKEGGQSLSVDNFSIQPNNEFSVPLISYDLTNKLSIKVEKVDLCIELKTLLNNLLELFEDILVMCITEKLKDNKLLCLYKNSDNMINKSCQYFYKIGLKKY